MKPIRIFFVSLTLFCIFTCKELESNAHTPIKSNDKAFTEPLWNKVDELCLKAENKVVASRRDMHQNPEVLNREFRISKLIAEHLDMMHMLPY